MKISQTGIDLIKHFEGLRLQSYQDIAGIWTIGYGHTGKEVGPNQTITEAEAEALLRKDLSRFESGVDSAVKIDIDQNMFDALVSLSYNIGVTAFKKSTAVRLLNKGDMLGAAEAITWWNKATINGVKTEVLGLVRRRAAEAALFLQNMTRGNLRIEEDEPEDATRMQPEENNPRRNNPITTRTTGGAAVAGAAGAAGAGSAMQHGDEEEAEREAEASQTDGATTPIDTPVEPEAEPEL